MRAKLALLLCCCAAAAKKDKTDKAPEPVKSAPKSAPPNANAPVAVKAPAPAKKKDDAKAKADAKAQDAKKTDAKAAQETVIAVTERASSDADDAAAPPAKAKDSKDSKKDAKDSKEPKDAKASKDSKGSKDAAPSKDAAKASGGAKAAPKAPPPAADPRTLPACRKFYGDRGDLSVVTTEDRIAKRDKKAPRPTYDCTLKAPYGRFVAAAAGPPVWFHEIPKCGSTTVKAWLGAPHAQNKRNRRFAIDRSFAVVREPLDRFLSGYGTVRHRGARHWPFNDTSADEATTFERFVDMLLREGDGLATSRPKERCLWYHVLSQAWFFELAPKRVDRVLRLETLGGDLPGFLREFPLVGPGNKSLATALPQRQNTVEGNFDTDALRTSSPKGIAGALRYLAQDYACLGYPLPAGAKGGGV